MTFCESVRGMHLASLPYHPPTEPGPQKERHEESLSDLLGKLADHADCNLLAELDRLTAECSMLDETMIEKLMTAGKSGAAKKLYHDF